MTLPPELEARARELSTACCIESGVDPLPTVRCAMLAAIAYEREQVMEWKKRNPLGGPAPDFEAMASRIRAGEPLDDVLADFGYARLRSGESAQGER